MTKEIIFPRELVEALAEHHVVPIIGAGLSIGAGYPSWNELCQELKQELVEDGLTINTDDNRTLREQTREKSPPRTAEAKVLHGPEEVHGVPRPANPLQV
jgi:hypothetical protein